MKQYIFCAHLGFLFFFLILIGCSNKSDKEYMKLADRNVNQNNISEAVKAYQTLAEEYPESDLAPEALYQLASLYQNNIVKGISKEQSLKKSVEIYDNIYKNYPKSMKAPMSLFMKGYILANELKDYDKASQAYNLFIEKYPHHELTISAKEELDHLGLTPDEILNEKTQKHI